jgi:hypothetical protein
MYFRFWTCFDPIKEQMSKYLIERAEENDRMAIESITVIFDCYYWSNYPEIATYLMQDWDTVKIWLDWFVKVVEIEIPWDLKYTEKTDVILELNKNSFV